jgi:NADH-quinone oxidoreductase subunit L
VTGTLLVLVALPFVAAALSLLVGHQGEVAERGIAVGASALGLGVAVVVAFVHLGDAAPFGHVYASTDAVGPPIELSLYVDQLTAVMLLLVHTVAFLVQVYSLGYLAGDRRYPSYAALVSIFTGAMTLVVTADDLWVLLIGWELMGACSYFLISHHWELPEARSGAVKAFLMTRTADLGLLFGILVLGDRFGSYRISTIMAQIGAGRTEDLWLPALLLTAAVVGKSAQFPLHTWLPDAMPGPTPISALIHAATMVAAGVFLVARTYPLFLASPAVLAVLAVVASITMLVAAGYALLTGDLKRVLAWSTVSQLAYMFGALAVGAWSAAVLHLLAHGAFKALLFLAAGSVMHAVGTTSMDAMGGLRERLPDTFTTMTFGFGALAGVVPFVGFFTKDAVIGAAWEQASHGDLVAPWAAWLVLVSAVLTAVVTVAYSLRAWGRVFLGTPAAAELATEADEPHEPARSMRAPLYILSVPTLLGGLAIAYPELLFGSDREYDLVHPPVGVTMTLLVALTAVAVLGVSRRTGGRDPWAPHLLATPPVDRLYDASVVRPTYALARLVRAGDRDVVEAYADGLGATVRGAGWLVRRAQNGNVQGYLMVVVVGAAVIAVVAGVIAG